MRPDYSSICCFVGTNRGNFATFKILPAADGTYIVTFAGAIGLDDKVISINPIDADRGGAALATPNAVGGLRNGVKINGVVIAVTPSGCRLFKPATSKGAQKSWDDYLCDSAAVVKTEARGHSLVGLFGDGNARAFSIPALKEIGCSRIGHLVDMRRLSEACVSSTGAILAWTGPSEVGLFNAWGSGNGMYAESSTPRVIDADYFRRPSDDQLFNVQAAIPPRPTITNIQWISGTQYVTPADMDILSKYTPTPGTLHGPHLTRTSRWPRPPTIQTDPRANALRRTRTPQSRSRRTLSGLPAASGSGQSGGLLVVHATTSSGTHGETWLCRRPDGPT